MVSPCKIGAHLSKCPIISPSVSSSYDAHYRCLALFRKMIYPAAQHMTHRFIRCFRLPAATVTKRRESCSSTRSISSVRSFLLRFLNVHKLCTAAWWRRPSHIHTCWSLPNHVPQYRSNGELLSTRFRKNFSQKHNVSIYMPNKLFHYLIRTTSILYCILINNK